MSDLIPFTTNNVMARSIKIRGQEVLLDRDVAELYGVETKRINEALRNNPDKFPEGYVFTLYDEVFAVLRSKISTLEQQEGRVHQLDILQYRKTARNRFSRNRLNGWHHLIS